MIKLSSKNRRLLRALYLGLGVTAFPVVFNACDVSTGGGWGAYGMPPDYIREEILIHGKVVVKGTEDPINGIVVHIKDLNTNYYHPIVTNFMGNFYIYVPKKDNYTIVFTDVDDEENGGRFKQQIINLTKKEAEALTENPLTIELEKEEILETDAE